MKLIEVFRGEVNYALPTTPEKFMEYWRSKIVLVPEEFEDTAEIIVEAEEGTYDGSVDLNVVVQYSRPKTKEEIAEDLANRQAHCKLQKERDMETLSRLQKKYGDISYEY